MHGEFIDVCGWLTMDILDLWLTVDLVANVPCRRWYLMNFLGCCSIQKLIKLFLE